MGRDTNLNAVVAASTRSARFLDGGGQLAAEVHGLKPLAVTGGDFRR